MISILNIDLDSLVLSRTATGARKKGIDFAVIESNIDPIWYDGDNGIQIKFVDSDRSENVQISLDGEMIVHFMYWKDGKIQKERAYIPIQPYTEESFFMASTISDFGSVSFEYYTKLQNIASRVYELVRAAEDN